MNRPHVFSDEPLRALITKIYENLTSRNDLEFSDLHDLFFAIHLIASPIKLNPKSITSWDPIIGLTSSNGSKFRDNPSPTVKKLAIRQVHITRFVTIAKALFFVDLKPGEELRETEWEGVLSKIANAAKPSVARRPKEDPLSKSKPPEELQPHPSKNLVYVGDNSISLRELPAMLIGATYVVNTVFTRSEPMFAYAEEDVERFIAAMKTFLDQKKCAWDDIVAVTEEAAIKQLYRSLTSKQKGRYHPKIIKTELPLFQCVVIRYSENRLAALVGWSFLGTKNSRVYLSQDKDTCNYFLDYCQKLFAHHCDDMISARDKVPRTSMKKSKKQKVAKPRS